MVITITGRDTTYLIATVTIVNKLSVNISWRGPRNCWNTFIVDSPVGVVADPAGHGNFCSTFNFLETAGVENIVTSCT